MSENLSNLRKEINEIDEELIKIIKKRMDVSVKIGKFKKENNIEVLNTNREKEVIANIMNFNDKINANLEEEFIKELWILLMNYSKKIQV